MDKYLSIVEEHSQRAMDEAKLRQFLEQTKVWEYAKISKNDYVDMSSVDRFALLQGYYNYMDKNTGQGIDFFFLAFLAKFVTILLLFFYRANRFG